jgi:hypothetical protein
MKFALPNIPPATAPRGKQRSETPKLPTPKPGAEAVVDGHLSGPTMKSGSIQHVLPRLRLMDFNPLRVAGGIAEQSLEALDRDLQPREDRAFLVPQNTPSRNLV